MKKRWLLIGLLAIGSFLVLQALPTRAQKSPKALTVLYSNNLNGEIDPCPT